MTNEEMVRLAIAAAKAHNLDPALICAIVEQESGWNPWATRYEPAFFAKYISVLYTNNKIHTATEAYSRSFSWGLMQLMGEDARELGFANTYLSSLLDPATALEWGCRQFAKELAKANGDTHKALFFWNGGGNALYPDQVIARVPKYNVDIPSNHDTVQQAASGET
jgi:soluble lytic murein transglycosylase-like protein